MAWRLQRLLSVFNFKSEITVKTQIVVNAINFIIQFIHKCFSIDSIYFKREVFLLAELTKPNATEVFEMIDAALKHDPSATKGKEGVFEFQLKDDEDGTYQIIIDNDGARAVKGAEEKAACTLIVSTDDFRQMVDGTLNPTAAFMGGKLKIKGNMGLALKLQTILNSFSF